MIVRELKDDELGAYDELAQEQGRVFNGTEWISHVATAPRLIGVFDKGKRLVGGVALDVVRKLGLSIARNPPLTPTIGPFLRSEAQNPAIRQGIIKRALGLIAEYVDSLRLPIVSISLDRRWQDMQPFLWRGFKVSPVYTYLLDLRESEKQLWESMSSDRRKSIRRAQTDDITVALGAEPGRLVSLIDKTFRRQRMAYDRAVVERVVARATRKESLGFAYVATVVGRDLACAVCVRDGETAYYLLGGYDDQQRHHGAGAACIWQSIRHAQQLGLQSFDFEGSSVPAIERYFRGFGGELTVGFRATKAWLPLEMLLKLRKRTLF